MKSWGNKMAIYQNQILESSYLTAPNYVTYRSIMRVMFLESEQMLGAGENRQKVSSENRHF